MTRLQKLTLCAVFCISGRALAQKPVLNNDTQGTLALNRGGTNQNSWTAGRCVQVNAGGTALEAASDACGGSPVGATYITQTPDASLTAEQALSLLATGILKSTTGTGVVSIAVDADFPATLTRDTEVGLPGTDKRVAFYDGTTALAGASVFVWDKTNLRVGVGITVPTAGLHVFGSGATSLTGLGGTPVLVKFESPSGTVPWAMRQDADSALMPTFMWLETSEGDFGRIGATASDTFGIQAQTGMKFSMGAGGIGTQVVIDTTGKFGIGTTSPATLLSLPSSAVHSWELSAGVADIGLARNAAGVLEVNNGTAGTFRDAKLRALELTAASPIVFEGATVDTNETTLVVTDPTAARTFTLPNANSVAIQPLTCSGTDKVSAVSALGVITCSADTGGGTSTWEGLVNTADTATTYLSNNTAETVDFQFQAAFTTGCQFCVRQNTGNPTGATLFEVRVADADVMAARIGNTVQEVRITEKAVVDIRASNPTFEPKLFVTSAGADYPYIATRSSQGTLASPTATTNGNPIGGWLTYGYDGAAFQIGSLWEVDSVGTWSGTNRATTMSFNITATASTDRQALIYLEDTKAIRLGWRANQAGAGGGDAFTVGIRDGTATTGVTRLTVEAGDGQSTNPLQVWQVSGGASKLSLVAAGGEFEFNPGTTAAQGILMDMAQPGVVGQRDSHWIELTGTSFDTAGHDADHRVRVDVTSDAGASSLAFESRIDAGAFTERARLTDGGVFDVATGFRIGGAAASNNVLAGDGTNFVSTATSGGGAPVGASRAINTTSPYLAGGGNLSADRNLTLAYTATLAGDPALNAEECVFSTDGTGGGILCEGSVADANEGLLVWDVTGSDKTLTLPNATDTLVARATTDTLTNKTVDAEATGNVITIPVTVEWIAAVCQNTTASLGTSTFTSNQPSPVCVTPGDTTWGVAQFPDADGDYALQFRYMLPDDWNATDIDVEVFWRVNATTGNVVWQFSSACVASGESHNPSWDSDVLTITDAALGTNNLLNEATGTLAAASHLSTCAAGEILFARIYRNRTHASDTLGAVTPELLSWRYKLRRAL